MKILAYLIIISAFVYQLTIYAEEIRSLERPPTIDNVQPVRIQRGVTDLLEIGVYRVGYEYFGRPPSEMPPGWTGHFDGPTGISCTPYGQQNGKSVLLLHCPWRNGTGIAYVEYDFALPKVTPISLKFSIAMKSDIVSRSDGVTFRAFVKSDGGTRKLIDLHYTSDEWRDYSFDLSEFADSTITLRLETDPGPDKSPSWDYSFWGDPKTVVGKAGEAQRIQYRYLAEEQNLLRLANRSNVGCRPTTDNKHSNRINWREQDKLASFEYQGDDCAIRYEFRPKGRFLDGLRVVVDEGSAYQPCLGGGPTIVVGDKSFTAKDAALRHSFVSSTLKSKSQPNESAQLFLGEEYYTPDGKTIKVRTALSIAGKSLVIQVSSEDPHVSAFSFGQCGPAPLRRIVSMPYLGTGKIRYFPDSQLYSSVILDWAETMSSNQSAATAYYQSKTDGTRNALSETAYITFSPELPEVLPNIPNPPSPFIAELAGRVMFDIWGGRYVDNAEWLKELATYGVRNAAIINHVWQRSGYDNALPNHVPANAVLGGDEGMKTFVKTARDLGHLVSLHENYVDFYPNSELYDEKDVALRPDGKLTPAWKNIVQSYGFKPTAIMKYARMMSPEIHKRYGTNASYLDVHTCVPPWFHVDFRASEPGAGTCKAVWAAHSELFAFERDTHGGPLFGEGANHFFWAGLFDGAEAQVAGGEGTPLLLDFDLLKIHPQMVNHGMGYIERWLTSGYSSGWGSRIPPMEAMDKYRATELAYGHAGFIANQVWRVPPYVLKEYYLVTPIQSRYCAAKVRRILYDVEGKLLPSSAAVAERSTNRACIVYDSGLTLYVNRSERDWEIDGRTLPPYSFFAKAPDLVAYTSYPPRQTGDARFVVDYRESDGIIYADARSHVYLPRLERKEIQPKVRSFESIDARRFRITYEWQVDERVEGDWTCFVHFTNPRSEKSDKIAFQQDHGLPKPISQVKAGEALVDGPYEIAIPDEWGDGQYDLKAGLFNAGGRLSLQGKDDGAQRIILGKLKAADGKITFEPATQPESKDTSAAYLRRVNVDKVVVDFGKVSTNGCVIIGKTKDGLLVTPVPREERLTVKLNLSAFDPEWRLKDTTVSVLDRDRGRIASARAKLTAGDEVLELDVGLKGACYYAVTKRAIHGNEE